MGVRILVVDDEPAIARLVKVSLLVEGYEVHTATSGFEALQEVKSWKPDLLILDIMMPGMSGYQVCREIKSRPASKDIKIIFLTARGNSGDMKQGLMVGGDGYMIKPFDPEVLLDKVGDIIDSAIRRERRPL